MNPTRNYDKTAINMCNIIKCVVYLCHECDVCNVVLYWSDFIENWQLCKISLHFFHDFFSLAISYVTNIYWHQKVVWATDAWQMRRLCCTKMGYYLNILLAPTVHWHVFLLCWHLTENYVPQNIFPCVFLTFYCLGIQFIVPWGIWMKFKVRNFKLILMTDGLDISNETAAN